jgi:hypothetical protein
MKWLAVFFLPLCLCSGMVAQSSEKQAPQKSPPPSEIPQVIIKPQPEVSLRVASAKTAWTFPYDGTGIEIFIVVENAGDRPIRAFATRRDNVGVAGRTTCFLNNLSLGKILRRGQTDGKSTFQHYSPAAPAPTIWVDFVEFTDNSTWGADECHCADRLAGERAGARAIKDLMLKLLADGGPESVLKLLRDYDEKIKAARESGNPVAEEQIRLVESPSGHSIVFDEGFRFGASSMIGRVVTANQEWGSSEIEAALRRPYDASEIK